MCVIDIYIFFTIQSVQIKNSIVYVRNIIIFIITQIIDIEILLWKFLI